MEQTYHLDQKNEQLSRAELLLLLLPVAASAFVGLFQLLLPGALANLTGYSGNDVIVYWFSGAATFGYAGALSLAPGSALAASKGSVTASGSLGVEGEAA